MMNPIFLLFCLVLVIAAVWGIFRPAIAPIFLILLFPIKQTLQLNSPLIATDPILANILCAAFALIAWAGVIYRGERFRAYSGGVRKWAIIFMLYMLVTTLWAPDLSVVMRSGPAVLVYIFFLVFFIPELLTQQTSFGTLYKAFLYIAGAVTVTILCTATWDGREIVFIYSPLVWVQSYGAWRHANGNPLTIATSAMEMFLIILLLPSAALGRALAWLRWPLLFAAVYLVLKSETRAALVTMMATAIVFYPISRSILNQRSFAATIGIIVLLIPVGLWIQSAVAGSGRWSILSLSQDTETRIHILSSSIHAWTANPLRLLFGYGFDASFLPDLDIGWPEVGPVALLVDGGLVGFAIWISVLVRGATSWVTCWRAVRHDPAQRAIVAVLGAFPFAEMIISLKGSGYVYVIGWILIISRYQALLEQRAQFAPGAPEDSLIKPHLAGTPYDQYAWS